NHAASLPKVPGSVGGTEAEVVPVDVVEFHAIHGVSLGRITTLMNVRHLESRLPIAVDLVGQVDHGRYVGVSRLRCRRGGDATTRDALRQPLVLDFRADGVLVIDIPHAGKTDEVGIDDAKGSDVAGIRQGTRSAQTVMAKCDNVVAAIRVQVVLPKGTQLGELARVIAI